MVYVPVPAAADPYSEPDPYEDEPEGYPEMAMQAVYPAPKKSGKGGAYGGRGKRSLYGYRGGFGRFGGFGYPFVSFVYLFQFKFTLFVKCLKPVSGRLLRRLRRLPVLRRLPQGGILLVIPPARRPHRNPEPGETKLVEPDR